MGLTSTACQNLEHLKKGAINIFIITWKCYVIKLVQYLISHRLSLYVSNRDSCIDFSSVRSPQGLLLLSAAMASLIRHLCRQTFGANLIKHLYSFLHEN